MRFFSSRKSVPVDAAAPRPRRRLMAVVAGGIATLLVGAGLTVAAVAPAEAHGGGVKATCTTLSIDYDSYPSGPNDVNKIHVEYGPEGGALEFNKDFEFKGSFHDSYDFADSSKNYTYRTKVVSADSANNGGQFDFESKGTTEGCKLPSVAIDSKACDVTNATSIPFTVTAASLRPDHDYVLSVSGQRDVQVDGAAGASQTFPFTAPSTGGDYTATVKDLTTGKSATTTGRVDPCPTSAPITIEVAPCTTGGAPQLIVTSTAFVEGRSYNVSVDNGAAVGYTVTGGKITVPVLNVTSSRDVIVQVRFGSNQDSWQTARAEVVPCPGADYNITATADGCVVDKVTHIVTINVGGLVAGRTYQVTVAGASRILDENGNALTDGKFTKAAGASTTRTFTVDGLRAGTYRYTLTDTTAQNASKPITGEVTVEQCAQTPKLEVTPEACTVPGGKGGITATVTNLVTDGRDYTATLRDAAGAVVGTPQTFKAGANGSAPLDFGDVTPNTGYTVTVVDSKDAKATTTSKTITPADCPPNPGVGGVSIACVNSTTAATLVATFGNVTPGRAWTVTLEQLNSNGTYTVVTTRPATGTGTETFNSVVNGATYRITLHDTTPGSTIPDAVENTVVDCASVVPPTTPPTTPNGVLGVSLLATTGADVIAPAIGAAALLQLGALLVALTVIRRRKESRGL